jgi:predicted pyridoxine 5'-phosphate oxidase superfamily flavin-nucleotide-binding protein
VSDRVNTSAQVALRVLLRGFPLGEGASLQIAGHRATVTQRAKPSQWPAIAVERGDLEAVIWCDPRHVAETMQALATERRVLAVDAPGEQVAPKGD